jgi:lipoprotein-anchoring transpeptidase ErfK/SrfK
MRLLNKRLVLAALAIAAIAFVGSAGPSSAAVAPSPPGVVVASVSPRAGETVGVAADVMFTFTKPVADRTSVERSFTITAPTNPTGQFEWLNDQTLRVKPNGYWPAHSVMKLSFGNGGFSTDITTGSLVQGVADISAHTFTVSIDGQVVKTMPASMGKPSRPTPMGNFSVLSREQSVVMDSRTIGIPLSSPEGYKITANYAERITSGGVYVHSAPWSVDSQGNSNVSHGCINLSPDNAKWYYNTVHIGDPVIVQA